MSEKQRVRIRGDRLKQAREKKRLSQAALAQMAGIKQRTVSDYENGLKFAIPGDVFVYLCDALHISPYYLLGQTDDPCPDQWLSPDWLAFISEARSMGYGPEECRKGLECLRLARQVN